MRAFVFAFIIFSLSVEQIFSQNDDGNKNSDSDSYITFSPLSLLDIYSPRLRVGYVQHIGGHWKLGIDLGAGGGTSLFSQREAEDGILWEVRPEIYYRLGKGSRTPKYISAEFFYIDESITLLNDGYQREDGVNLLYDKADYNRQKYGMHLKFGLFLNLGRRFGFNFYGGLGFRFKDVSFGELTNAREGTAERPRHGFKTIYEQEERDFRPNPALGFKCYYRL
ncbi:hypothetical protein D9O36_00070 [Zobellia amurskyensis]|uniref:Outer membrane protein beta-barrel domain-containing protein n=1 Tax=Zobellia amurskyensis TaxID=248905 RepID=A0A7X2ZPJ8_9FLAO|nr:hypothetical protein [Zobellia amurskyensis]MUH34226.1 hypothetical protein [Zobellia amurskyensis]